MNLGSDNKKWITGGIVFILVMIGLAALFRPCDLSISWKDGIRQNCTGDVPRPPGPTPSDTESPRPGPRETAPPGRRAAPDDTPGPEDPSDPDPVTVMPDGGRQGTAPERPPSNFAWQINEFERLDPPRGYTWYEVRDMVATPQTSLVRIPEEDWPRLEELMVGHVLAATGYKNIRRRPVESSRLTTLDPDSCVRVIEGRRYYFDRQTERRSSGWLPVEQVSCPD